MQTIFYVNHNLLFDNMLQRLMYSQQRREKYILYYSDISSKCQACRYFISYQYVNYLLQPISIFNVSKILNKEAFFHGAVLKRTGAMRTNTTFKTHSPRSTL
jgi:hypothetical protein